jgi:hypothetical protein
MKRRGISLMELMVVMSAASMIITTSALVLHKMMRAQEQTRYFFENERAVERLARQFRRDVHDASDVEIDVEATEIEAEGGDGSLIALIRYDDRAIAYVRTLAGIVRTVHPGEGTPARETFALAPFARLTIEEESMPRTLTLTIASSPADFVPRLGERAPTIRETPVSMQVIAVVGRDAQYRDNPIVAIPSVASNQGDGP